MKKLVKRSAALLFAVALVMSMMVVPASALKTNVVSASAVKTALKADEVEMDTSYLSKEKCWTEAAKYVDITGLSQPRIARELYAHALADNIGYKAQHIDTRIRSMLADYLVEHGHIVQIGYDSKTRENIFSAAWRVVDIDGYDTYYNIHSNLNYQKVIDVQNNSDANGAKIQLYRDNGSRAQKFALYYKGDGWYNIFKKDTFQCLDVSGGIADAEVNVQLYEYNGTAAQDWALIDTRDGDNSYYILNRLGFYLDACGGSSDDGTQIWTYTLNRSDAQKWGFSYAWG